ncbi:MAG TPA: hypothetical protein VIH37_11625 [Candidatus Limnocylindrales bacterium]
MRRNRIVRVAIAWTVVSGVTALAVAAVAVVRLYEGEQACFFMYPATPCPEGPDLLPVAFFVIPGVWLLGLLALGLFAAVIDRRSSSPKR